MAQKDGKETKYTRFFKAPIRVLTKARDFYVQTMLNWAARDEYGGASGYCIDATFNNPGSRTSSFGSTRNSTQIEDLSELMTAASARNLSERTQSEILQRPRHVKAAASRRSLRWTRGGGIGRIEEDRPCEFGQDVTIETRHADQHGRSRKCIVSQRAD